MVTRAIVHPKEDIKMHNILYGTSGNHIIIRCKKTLRLQENIVWILMWYIVYYVLSSNNNMVGMENKFAKRTHKHDYTNRRLNNIYV